MRVRSRFAYVCLFVRHSVCVGVLAWWEDFLHLDARLRERVAPSHCEPTGEQVPCLLRSLPVQKGATCVVHATYEKTYYLDLALFSIQFNVDKSTQAIMDRMRY
ncbi:hypothetical protein BDN71DRAFT_524785 [Pleurotus eryngii]|uniref:Uncharacterized protein n=1 Tax=Pleurotus eryngii TaxID=5323 RepID=A0A9P5ZJ40_PLEER|nr:hypothetical protein BDN71DRAFT_524785 [Pleurotus eryngii]